MANGILVLTESKGGKLKKSSCELLSEAGRLGGEVYALWIGHGAGKTAEDFGLYGAIEAYVADHEGFARYSPERYAAVVAEAVRESGAAVVLATAGSIGRDLMPRVAARLSTGMITEATAICLENGKVIATRPIYAGKVLVTASIPEAIPQIVTCRPNVFEVKPAAAPTSPKTVAVGAEAAALPLKAKVAEVIDAKSDRPDLPEAAVIVAAGRAIKSAENFKLMGELADLLGGAVGATRAAVDAGFASHAIQVGQTGKTVNPKLYFAFGISGAIQHLAGMQTSKVIVAVNSDPQAPIFEKADYGIVGDLFEVVPVMISELRKILKD